MEAIVITQDEHGWKVQQGDKYCFCAHNAKAATLLAVDAYKGAARSLGAFNEKSSRRLTQSDFKVCTSGNNSKIAYEKDNVQYSFRLGASSN